MPLKTFEVPWLEGRVRFANPWGSLTRVTVECPHRKLAFQLDHQGPPSLSNGRWVRVRGKVRHDPSVRKDGTLAEQNLGYIHVPYDGTPRGEWLFFKLVSPEVKILGPKEATDAMREAVTLMRRHLDSWSHNCRAETLDQTLEAMEAAVRIVRVLKDDVSIPEQEPVIVPADLEL